MHFTYEEELSTTTLRQGDVLKRTPALESVLQEVHPHYFQHSENAYFQVLTQSCDLVRRAQTNGKQGCAARYISLAPVRPLELVINRYLEIFIDPDLKMELPICSDRTKLELKRFLERLINNNETKYFYLEREPTKGFATDHCTFLPLSVAIKAELHYETCLHAKILELKEPFQAKLGWLVGQMYSRVGTRDWSETDRENKILNNTDSYAIFLNEKLHGRLKKEVRSRKKSIPSFKLTNEAYDEIVGGLKSRREEVAEQIANIISANPEVASDAAKIRSLVISDPTISSLIRD